MFEFCIGFVSGVSFVIGVWLLAKCCGGYEKGVTREYVYEDTDYD